MQKRVQSRIDLEKIWNQWYLEGYRGLINLEMYKYNVYNIYIYIFLFSICLIFMIICMYLYLHLIWGDISHQDFLAIYNHPSICPSFWTRSMMSSCPWNQRFVRRQKNGQGWTLGEQPHSEKTMRRNMVVHVFSIEKRRCNKGISTDNYAADLRICHVLSLSKCHGQLRPGQPDTGDVSCHTPCTL